MSSSAKAHRVKTTGSGFTRQAPDALRVWRDTLATSSPIVRAAPFPSDDSVRRIYPWLPFPVELRGPSLARTAHHEAGHIVMLEWIGLIPVSAMATDRRGNVRFDWPPNAEGDQHGGPPDVLAASAAAVFHGGLVAELVYAGIPWRGVIADRRQPDFQLAQELLQPHFGMSSCGHAFAQRFALAVITRHWARITEIADVLIENGHWP